MHFVARAIDNMKLVAWNSARQIGNVALVFGLQPKVVADLRALFQSFDTDNSGALSRDEYIKAMAIFAPDLSREDVERLFTILDIDNDGGISYTEFLSATLDPRQIDINGLNEAFRLMDADGNGFIEVDEIRRMLSIEKSRKNTKQIESSLDMSSSYYDDFSDEEEGDNRTNKMIESRVQEMMDLYDVNHDGKISYDGKCYSCSVYDVKSNFNCIRVYLGSHRRFNYFWRYPSDKDRDFDLYFAKSYVSW